MPAPTDTGGKTREETMTDQAGFADTADTATHRDPVCGMSVDPMTATASTQVDGQTYYFCSEDCYRTFMADPKSYTKA